MSDNKNLLNESTIRRFQKLASIPSININETGEQEQLDEKFKGSKYDTTTQEKEARKRRDEKERSDRLKHGGLSRAQEYAMMAGDDYRDVDHALDEEVNENDDEEVNEANKEELDEKHCPSGNRDEDEKDVKKENNEAEELEEAEEEVEEGYGMHAGERDDDEPADDAEEMDMDDVSLSDEEAQLLVSLGQKLAAAMDAEPADDAEEELDAGEDEDEPDAMEMPPMEEGEDIDELVNEIYKRVAKRIVAEKLKNK